MVDLGVSKKDNCITALATVSLRKILDMCNGNTEIHEIRGSTYHTRTMLDDELHDIGCYIREGKTVKFELNNTKSSANLSGAWLKRLEKKMDKKDIYDIPIEKLVLHFKDNKLGKIATKFSDYVKASDKDFIATFIADRCDGKEDADIVREKNKELIRKPHRFKLMSLNLIRLINKEQMVLSMNNRKYLVNITGKTQNSILNPYAIAGRLKSIFGELAINKFYNWSKENKRILVRVE